MNLKILHTSDWHLGQALWGRERIEEHQLFLDWLLGHLRQEAEQEKPYDLLLVAGDVFDSNNPPGEARAQYHRFLARLYHGGHCRNVVVVAGNHDSTLSLDATREILAELNVKVVGQSVSPADDLHTLRGDHGQPIGLICCAPFLRGSAITLQPEVPLAQCIRESTSRYYQEALQAAREQRETLGLPELPILATGHLWATGAKVGGSEREIQVGQLDHFGAEDFAGFDYVALGHIHLPQQVGQSEAIQYCGSPLALSFAEVTHAHQVLAVEVGQGVAKAVPVEVPCQRKLLCFEGEPAQVFEFLSVQGQRDQSAEILVPWLELKVFLSTLDVSLTTRLREASREANVDIVKQHMETPEIRARLDLMQAQARTTEQLTPLSVFKILLDGQPNLAPQLLETFNELLATMPLEVQP